MCFSATASFSSGVVLSIIGITSIRKAPMTSQVPFAAIPFIFAIQQFSEGFVWLSFTNPGYYGWQPVSSYIFLSFAHVVWPVWVPIAVLLLEKNIKQRNLLYLLSGCGIVLGYSYAYSLVNYPLSVNIDGHHVQYNLKYPSVLFALTTVFYGLATIAPAFISTVKRMKWLAIFITISYIATFILYNEYIISVWCYFAAVLSIVIYWIILGLKKDALNFMEIRVKHQS